MCFVTTIGHKIKVSVNFFLQEDILLKNKTKDYTGALANLIQYFNHKYLSSVIYDTLLMRYVVKCDHYIKRSYKANDSR